jgi:hypothetical protein
MNPDQAYEQLEQLANQLGITIRHENLSRGEVRAASGLCTLRGQHYYFMDTAKPLKERISLLADCLAQMDLEGVYIRPALRRFLGGRWETG